MSLMPSAEFIFQINCLKNISFRIKSRVPNTMDLDKA